MRPCDKGQGVSEGTLGGPSRQGLTEPYGRDTARFNKSRWDRDLWGLFVRLLAEQGGSKSQPGHIVVMWHRALNEESDFGVGNRAPTQSVISLLQCRQNKGCGSGLGKCPQKCGLQGQGIFFPSTILTWKAEGSVVSLREGSFLRICCHRRVVCIVWVVIIVVVAIVLLW